eukprot:CAMPEP_0203005376 /NCGR_PEP_ID=MMETSP1401-20130829/2920_1 /ASSEMBLY_ACC=CAM_ASM_000894 /TAXON_ID=38833 /ORGANISM="Micromonas pusilla, Strain CCAC1681" /LENGTH=530 /DNA_ID=CAMNT_0049747001 /DNA_START=129 /DNA_END=1718 /DNA_ORIENTATION=+
MEDMDWDDAAFFTRSRQAQAHDDDDGEGMSDAALLKRKREERSRRVAARARAKEDAMTRGHQEGRRNPARGSNFALAEYLHARERGGSGFPRRDARVSRESLATRAPYTIEEHEMPASLIARFDKCFAAAWLDQSRVVLGTKDNALVVMDVDARTCERVALPARREFRPPARRRRPRRFATRGVPDFYVGDVLTRRDSNPGGHALMHVETELVSNVADAPVYRFGDSPVRSLEGVSASPSTSAEVDFEFETDSDSDSDGSLRDSRRFENCGIHAISLNSSRTRLATGGENPRDVAVFSASLGDEASLSSHASRRLLTPSALLVGHRDWVFGVDWITDNVLASGSRDATVRIWSVPDGGASNSPDRETKRGVSSGAIPEIREPVASIRAHADRVRDVRYARRARRLVSLSVDGTVAFTDPEVMAAIDTRRLRSRRELMCLATDGGDATAIGSQAHVALLDHRAKTNRACEKKLPHDDADGVRSLSFSGGGRLLTVGGGGGRLFFFDVVAGKFLPRVLGVDEEGGSLVARAD